MISDKTYPTEVESKNIPDYLIRYLDFFAHKSEKIACIRRQIFRIYNKMIIPFGPINYDCNLSHEESKNICEQLGCILLRENKKFDFKNTHGLPWYAVICDKFVSLNAMKSKLRNQISKGLNLCEVRKISLHELIEMGYPIYKKASLYYSNVIHCISEEQFKREYSFHENFEDIIHHWGVFKDGVLIAYAINYVFDNIEVSYSVIKLDPVNLIHYPAYALIYEMNQYYLDKLKVKYVNDGFRSILHETNIQEFLIQKFYFRKAYCELNIYYPKQIGLIIKICYPFKSVLNKFDKRFKALFELENINRLCNNR